MTDTIVENHKVVLMEHELVVDGVLLRETKQLTTVTSEDDAQKEESTLIHTRSIGDRVYQIREVKVDGRTQDTHVETKLSPEQVQQFRNDWLSMWVPTITDEQAAYNEQPTLTMSR